MRGSGTSSRSPRAVILLVAAAVALTGAAVVTPAQPAAAQTARQVLVNPSFEEPGSNGVEPTAWTPVLLENETGPFNWAVETYNAAGQFPPPAPIPDGQFAAEVFWQVGSSLGVMGAAAEQRADEFGLVDHTGTNTLSYHAVQTLAPAPTVVDWAGAVVEVEFDSGGQTYALRYFHSNSGSYSGAPQDAADGSVRYVSGQAFTGDGAWLTASHDLGADIASGFGLAEYRIEAIRFGNLQERTGTSPFSNMTTYWDDVRLDTAGGEPDPTPPAVAGDGLRPADGATDVATTAPVTATFTEPVLPGETLEEVAITSGGAPLDGVQAGASGSTLTVAHGGLAPNTTHTVTVPAGAVTDRAGNALAEPVSWSFTTAPAAEPGELAQVHFIDVGQGESFYVELPGDVDILIDCGWLSTVEDVIHYLNVRGVDDIDLLISTHPSADHLGGCGVLMDEFEVEHIIDIGLDGPGGGPDTAPVEDYLAAREQAVAAGATYEVADFQRFDWDNASLELVGPVRINPSDVNESSVVAKLTIGDVDFMLTADAGFPAEADIVARARQEGIDIDVEFLKVGHHGSRFSTSEAWLDAVKPEWGIISVGENTFGHPTAETLGRLADAGVQVYRTDQDGNVVVGTDGVSANVNGDPVLGEQLPYEPVPGLQPPEVEPPVIPQPDGQQVLVNPSFEEPGQNGAPATGWLPQHLGAESAPFRLDVVAFGAGGAFPPPEPILDGDLALEVFWQTGDVIDRQIGVAAEQRADQFDAVVDESGEVTFSYAVAQTFGANPDSAQWGGALAEVLLTGGDGRQYTLRYFHANADLYRGELDPTGTETLQYVIGEAFPANRAWIAASHDLDADIAEVFGLTEFTVDSVRVGNLQERNTSWPFSQMATYWDLVRLHTTNPQQPEPIEPPGAFVPNSPIDAGDDASVAVADGQAWSWGNNTHGDGQPPATRTTPGPVPDLTVTAVDTSGSHTLALREDGTVWGWGGNNRGQLGNGDPGGALRRPVQALGLDNIVVAEASDHNGGNSFSMALRADGTVWAWGYNSSGQIGDGTSGPILSRSIPTRVHNLTGVVGIAAGAAHALAVKADGTVWAWGDNNFGQIGDGTTEDRLEPVQVPGLSDIVAVEAGNGPSYALQADGTVWAWGANFGGQLGDGTTEHRSTPAPVAGVDDVIGLSGFGGHVLALRTDGTVWGWGSNSGGQLGDGTTETRLEPVQVPSLSGITAVAAGRQYSLAVQQDGTVWAWGSNTNGQLGDGTTDDRHTPVAIELNLGEQEPPIPDACPHGHSPSETVAFGNVDSGVPNVDRGDGCTILDLVEAGAPFRSHGQFIKHVHTVTAEFRSADLITNQQRGAITAAAARFNFGH